MCLQIPTVDFRLLCSLFPFSRDAVHLSVLFSLIVPHHVRLPPLRQGFIRPRSCWGVNCTRNDRFRSVWEWGRSGHKVYQALGLRFSRGYIHYACKACVDIFVVCCVSLLECVCFHNPDNRLWVHRPSIRRSCGGVYSSTIVLGRQLYSQGPL